MYRAITPNTDRENAARPAVPIECYVAIRINRDFGLSNASRNVCEKAQGVLGGGKGRGNRQVTIPTLSLRFLECVGKCRERL